MVDKSITLRKDTSGWFFGLRQAGEAASVWSETYPTSSATLSLTSPHHKHCAHTWLSWLSSRYRRQGASQHLASRPRSGGSSGSHGGRPLSVALSLVEGIVKKLKLLRDVLVDVVEVLPRLAHERSCFLPLMINGRNRPGNEYQSPRAPDTICSNA
jgi:hypothetical protein